MIPKPLNEIEWSDIEALRDSGREEDDTIEYKGSFSGGSDFLAFNENQQKAAVDGIAKEALAFLNGRGGDVVIGVAEFKNDHPKIEKIIPLNNVIATADRLAQALAALIEPAQTVLTIRAIRQSDGNSDGVMIVRCPASLRAPHRSKRTKECYIRRGRESVPMPMDEIQDASVQRNLTRQERSSELERLFHGMIEGIVRRERLAGTRLHARIALLPFAQATFEIPENFLNTIAQSLPRLTDGGGEARIDDVFFRVNRIWRPVLRGKAQTNHTDEGRGDFMELVGREFRANGAAIYDAAWRIGHNNGGTEIHEIVPIRTMVEFIATALWQMRSLVNGLPASLPAVLELRTLAEGSIKFGMDSRGRDLISLVPGVTQMASFEVTSLEAFDDALSQMQRDLYALVERAPPYLLAFDN